MRPPYSLVVIALFLGSCSISHSNFNKQKFTKLKKIDAVVEEQVVMEERLPEERATFNEHVSELPVEKALPSIDLLADDGTFTHDQRLEVDVPGHSAELDPIEDIAPSPLETVEVKDTVSSYSKYSSNQRSSDGKLRNIGMGSTIAYLLTCVAMLFAFLFMIFTGGLEPLIACTIGSIVVFLYIFPNSIVYLARISKKPRAYRSKKEKAWAVLCAWTIIHAVGFGIILLGSMIS